MAVSAAEFRAFAVLDAGFGPPAGSLPRLMAVSAAVFRAFALLDASITRFAGRSTLPGVTGPG
jgi:hypothetical protein